MGGISLDEIRAKESEQSSLESWLKGLGFTHGHPFATVEADQERDLLPEFFVDIEGYERVEGDETLLVFAPRGSGKSALRIMLATQAAPISDKSSTLAIECTDFDDLINLYATGQPLRIEEHVAWLLRTALNEFLKTMEDSVQNEQGLTPRALLLKPLHRMHLSGLIRAYGGSLLNLESVYERFFALDPAFENIYWNQDENESDEVTSGRSIFVVLEEAITAKKLGAFIHRIGLGEHPVARLLADLVDFPQTNTVSSMTTTETVNLFVTIAQEADFKRVQFLIDCLDEAQDTADDTVAQSDILEPLVSHLSILELPHVAFKFFIPKETRDELVKRPTFRRDRLMDQMITVRWDDSRLEHLLIERLKVYSDETIQDLSLLFSKSRVGSGVVEEMISLAQGSPRRLLRAGWELFNAHLKHSGVADMLETADWEEAKQALAQIKPEGESETDVGTDTKPATIPEITFSDLEESEDVIPQLRLTAVSAYIGTKAQKLSPQEHQFLKLLIDNDGEHPRKEVIDNIWPEVDKTYADQALNSLLTRLRKKLGDNVKEPTYIRTIHGQGFRLQNFVDD